MHRTSTSQTAPTRGFTIVETLVAITIISILLALVVPALSSARDAAHAISKTNDVEYICTAIDNYRYELRRFPSDIPTLVATQYLDLELFPIEETLTDKRVVSDGYVYELIYDAEQIASHLDYLKSLGSEGEEIAAELERLSTEYLIFARPVIPGRMGCFFVYSGSNCVPHLIRDPECEALRLEMFRRIQKRALYDAGRLLLRSTVEPYAVVEALEAPETKAATFDLLDANGDETVTFLELRRFAGGEPAAANAANAAEPLVVLQDFMRYALEEEMKIGAGGEDIDHIGVTFEDLPPGELSDLYSADNFADLIDDLVVHDGVADSLSVKLRIAERHRLNSERADPATRAELESACAGLVRAFRNELQAQADKTVLLEDAVILDAAAHLLCPPPAETSE